MFNPAKPRTMKAQLEIEGVYLWSVKEGPSQDLILKRPKSIHVRYDCSRGRETTRKQTI